MNFFKNLYARYVGACIAAFAFLVCALPARADDGDLASAAMDALDANKTVVTNILKAVFGIALLYVVYKLIRRATNKS